MNFYFLSSKSCVVTWSQKCACTSLSRWIKHSFKEGQLCPEATSMRTYLAKEGHNHKDINKLKLFTCKKSPKANTVIVSYRDPASRITSSFINKFLSTKTEQFLTERKNSNLLKRILRQDHTKPLPKPWNEQRARRLFTSRHDSFSMGVQTKRRPKRS